MCEKCTGDTYAWPECKAVCRDQDQWSPATNAVGSDESCRGCQVSDSNPPDVRHPQTQSTVSACQDVVAVSWQDAPGELMVPGCDELGMLVDVCDEYSTSGHQ